MPSNIVDDEIYVMNPDGSDPIRLTNTPPKDETFPDCLPTIRTRLQDVALTCRPATDQFPAVSPNGKEVVFASTRHDPDSSPDFPNPFYNPEGDFELYVMDAKDDDGDGEGDNLRRLTNNAVTDSNPSWSPGGEKIAFTKIEVTNNVSSGEVYVMDAEDEDEDGNGADQTNLTNSPGFDGQPVFSPDGTRIAFISSRDGDNEIHVMNADGSGDSIKLTDNEKSDTQPEFSPNGKEIAFTSDRDGDFDIWTMNAEKESPVNVARNLTNNVTDTGVALNDRYPAWSPDGRNIAFWSGAGTGFGSDSEILVMNAQDGTGQKNLTKNQTGDIHPDWGPAFNRGSWSTISGE